MCPFSFFSKIERERLRDSSILPLNPYSNLLLNNMLHPCNKFFVVLQHTYYATPLPSCSRKPKICSLCQNKEYRRELFCRLKVFGLKEEIFLHRLHINCTSYTVCQLNIAVNGYFYPLLIQNMGMDCCSLCVQLLKVVECHWAALSVYSSLFENKYLSI